MNKIIPTIIAFLIIISAILWYFSGEKFKTTHDTGENKSVAAITEQPETTSSPPSLEIIDIENESTNSVAFVSSENVHQEKTESSVEIAYSVETKDKFDISTVKQSESVITKIPDPLIMSGNTNISQESAEDCSKSSESPVSEIEKQVSVNNSVPISMNNIETKIPDESNKDDEDVLPEYALKQSDNNILTSSPVYIPEKSWPDSNRLRRELTEEIALEYPYKEFNKRKIENNVWEVGEQLTFSVDYGFYRAGTATMTVMGTELVNGFTCYQIRTEARSNNFISTFYEVRDSVNSFIDVEGLFSRRFEKRLREGNYKSDRIVDFYPNRLLALNTREKYAFTEIPLYTQDILSSLYLLRTFNLEVGKDETLDVYADGKVYPLKIIIHEIEKVRVPAGKFECFKVEPILKSEGIFRQKGKLIVWLTCDNLKLPVKMKSQVIIGSITSNLEKYSTGVIE
ncbi:DUF3108 domain-containing protein [Candidatus Latescibacterota bacterium]